MSEQYTCEDLNNEISGLIKKSMKYGLSPIQIIGTLDFIKSGVMAQYLASLIRNGKIVRE